MKAILQNSNQDCLLACYAMILSFYNRNVPVYMLYNKEMIPPDGLSVSYLNKLNKEHRLTMKAYKGSSTDIITVLKESKVPVIAQWSSDHFIIIEKVRKHSIKILDPAIGKRVVSYQEFEQKFSDYIIFLEKKSDFVIENVHSPFIRILKETFVNSNLAIYFAALFASQLATIGFSVLVRNSVSRDFSNLISIILLVLLVLFQFISYILKQHAQVNSNLIYEKKVTDRIYEGLFSRPILYFRNNSTGSMIEKLNLKSNIRDSILIQILPAAINFLSVFVLLFYLGSVSFFLTQVLVVLVFCYTLINIILYQKKVNSNMEYMQKNIDNTAVLQEDLTQIDQIKAQNEEEKVEQTWKQLNRRMITSYNKLIKIDGFATFFNQSFNYMCVIIILIIGNLKNVAIADLLLFQTGISLFTSSVSSVQTAIFEFSKLKIYGNKLSELFIKSCRKKDMIIEDSKVAIKVSNVSYSYLGIEPIFQNINLTIKKGEKIAIVGQSGSGKSTLINVLLGLYDYQGIVEYGSVNFREKLGVVLQNMTLRQGTLFDNLIKDKETWLDQEELYHVLQDVNILDVVSELPKKIFSQIFSNGKNLSGGQMQRLLIAKSLLNDSKTIFWDEAFSSLDNSNRQHIYHNILENERYKNKTIIIVSHHLDVLEYVDKVVFVDEDTHNITCDTHNSLKQSSKNYNEFLTLVTE